MHIHWWISIEYDFADLSETVSYFKWILLNKRGDLLPPPLRERYPNFVDAAVYVYIFPGRGQNRQRGDVVRIR